MSKLISFVLFIWSINGFSQSTYEFYYPISSNPIPEMGEMLVPCGNYRDLNGNPYLNNGFQAGFLLIGDSLYRTPYMTIDLVSQQICLLDNLDKTCLYSEKIASIFVYSPQLGDFEHYVGVSSLRMADTRVRGFVVETSYGPYTVYVQPAATIKAVNENLDALGLNEKANIVKSSRFFLEDRNVLYEVNSKKNLLEHIDKGKRKRAESFIKKNKLKFKTLEDFESLFVFLSPANQ